MAVPASVMQDGMTELASGEELRGWDHARERPALGTPRPGEAPVLGIADHQGPLPPEMAAYCSGDWGQIERLTNKVRGSDSPAKARVLEI
jgi:hypothetical protein